MSTVESQDSGNFLSLPICNGDKNGRMKQPRVNGAKQDDVELLACRGPIGMGEELVGVSWSEDHCSANEGTNSPEPQAPRSSPEGSETGSSSSSGCDDNGVVDNRPRGRESGTGHAPSRAAQKEPSKSGRGEKKGVEDGGGSNEAGQGMGSGDWVTRPNRGGGGRQPRGNRGGGGGNRGGDRGKGGGRDQNSGRGDRGGGLKAGLKAQNHATKPTIEQLLLNKSLSGLDNPVAVLEALQGASERGIQINATNLATGIHRIASRGGGQKPKLLRNPWLGALLNLIYARLQENGSDFSARELSTVAWALGKLGFKVDLVFRELRTECERRGLSGFNWHDLSNLAWAHAVTPGRGRSWEGCMMMLAREAESRPLAGITPQALANLAWALSTLGLSYGGNSAQALLERIAEHAVLLGIKAFKPQEISAMLWAMAVGGVRASRLFTLVESHIVEGMLDGYNAQKMSTLACAFAQTGNQAPRLFEMMQEALEERAMTGFNPANTASIAWAFASAQHNTEEVLSVVEERVWQLGLQGFGDVQLVLLVWSLAASNYRGSSDSMGRDTLNMVEVELRKRKTRDMPESHLATLSWAFGRQGHPGGGGLLRVQKELLSRGWIQPEGEEDGSFAWSLAARSRSSRDKTPKQMRGKVTSSGGEGGGLMRMGFGARVNVVVGGGCWAVEGAEDAVEPNSHGGSEAWASPSPPALDSGYPAHWASDVPSSVMSPVTTDAVQQPTTWARPVPILRL